MLPRDAPADSDVDLLGSAAFQHHSASVLRSLMHASPEALPLLHHFQRLKQVSPHACVPSHPFSCCLLGVLVAVRTKQLAAAAAIAQRRPPAAPAARLPAFQPSPR